MTDAKYHVIGNAFGSTPWVLNLDPRTLLECQRAIAWQRQGQGQFDPPEYWRIAEYLPSQGFVDREGVAHVPGKGPYTDAAWAAFWERYGDDA